MSLKQRIVVLISGNGSNLQAIIDACAGNRDDEVGRGRINAEIACVISNRAGANGLERARKAGIAAIAIDHRQFNSRDAFDAEMMREIDARQPDLVVLAGFMRILTTGFVTHYRGRLINIHPSLLPRHPGLHTHRRALEAGDTEHGATVHFVTGELDGGPAIMQVRIAVNADDSEQSLAARLLQQEHVIYPLAIQWFTDDRLRLAVDTDRNLDRNKVLLDGKPLPPNGFQYDPWTLRSTP